MLPAAISKPHPNITLLPTDSGYTAESDVSWNAGAWLSPACIFTPYSAISAPQLSAAVMALEHLRTPFAMRGGGHMPIENTVNINSSSVILSSTNLNTLVLS
ncbi:hypothetical protein B7463_g7281, partial [Scytalidium lignicola]